MKILIVAERYWPEVGAAPSRLANMAEGLKENGCDVEVLTGLPNYPKGKIFEGYRGCLFRREEYQGMTLFRYWLYATVSRHPIARVLNMFSLAVTIWLFAFRWRRIKSYDCVIIQTPTLVVASSAMLIFKYLYRRCCLLNVSDIWPTTAVDMGVMRETDKSYRFMAALERFLYRTADGIMGQSQEILDHISTFRNRGQLFLYRNLQRYSLVRPPKKEGVPSKVVFSGMLGVAQNVEELVRKISFEQLGVEFHILGGGRQLPEIEAYIQQHPHCNVKAHGFVAKEEIADRLREMDAGIVPLATRIRGAVPSKIYDILPQGLPILFCGGGEGAHFINEHRVGMISSPGDYEALTQNIEKLNRMSDADYEAMSERCLQVSRNELDFDKQIKQLAEFIQTLAKRG